MFRETFKMSLKSIASNKVRSFLTMLGIIIGVIALIMLVSIANSTTQSVSDSINSLGTNTLTVQISDDKGNPYTVSSLSEIPKSASKISEVSPVASSASTAYSSYSQKYADDEDSSVSVNVTGTGSSYADIEGLTIANGRYFNITDVNNHTNVIIISSDLASTIMGTTDCVGETIKLDGISYQIIGVLEADNSGSSFGRSSYKNYAAYIPYTSLMRLSDSVSADITTFVASADSDDDLDTAESQLTQLLLQRFGSDSDAFTVQNASEIADAMEEVQSAMTLLIGGIAAISLLVGGIGIMNIMLVSVTERTREIGIRKAIGAGRGTILMQFLIEAILISLLGCAVGIGTSVIALKVMTAVTGSTYTLSMNVVWISVAFSSAIGIIFGIGPASKAAKKNPIEALRYTG